MAQLAINNSWQETVQETPFFLEHGRHPWIPGMTFKMAGITSQEGRMKAREGMPKAWRDALSRARKCILEATERSKRTFDKHRKEVCFEVGDRVLLSTKNLYFKGLDCRKLLPRFIGPFTVEEKVGRVSYKLALPDTMSVHPVFHVELLRQFKGIGVFPSPAVECEDGTVYWEIDSIVAVRGEGDKRRYRVRWNGFGPEWDTWEPRKRLMEDAPEAVARFHEGRVTPQ